jgi:lauroyl/myristoyl acyltransferase
VNAERAVRVTEQNHVKSHSQAKFGITLLISAHGMTFEPGATQYSDRYKSLGVADRLVQRSRLRSLWSSVLRCGGTDFWK